MPNRSPFCIDAAGPGIALLTFVCALGCDGSPPPTAASSPVTTTRVSASASASTSPAAPTRLSLHGLSVEQPAAWKALEDHVIEEMKAAGRAQDPTVSLEITGIRSAGHELEGTLYLTHASGERRPSEGAVTVRAAIEAEIATTRRMAGSPPLELFEDTTTAREGALETCMAARLRQGGEEIVTRSCSLFRITTEGRVASVGLACVAGSEAGDTTCKAIVGSRRYDVPAGRPLDETLPPSPKPGDAGR